ncbi:hypothetical protein [Neisseria elongata]|uniref:hypothetical protein n=1 Tax=Neisseria elongata TaxID=495 RepID=UPI000D3553F5|nr:hypothetical protein [Neisseria elongata]
MKAYFSVSELFGMGLEILPSSERGIQKKVNRENWQFREVAGRGGRGGKKREYLPPPEIRDAILHQQQVRALAEVPSVSTVLPPAVPPSASTVRRRRWCCRTAAPCRIFLNNLWSYP